MLESANPQQQAAKLQPLPSFGASCSAAQQHQEMNSSAPCDTCVYVSNLPTDAYEGTIRRAFDKAGIPVAGIELLKKGSFNRRRNAGLATVKLTSAADVARCIELLDGQPLQAGADPAQARPMIVRRDKFECCQLGYSGQQQQQKGGSGGSSDDV